MVKIQGKRLKILVIGIGVVVVVSTITTILFLKNRNKEEPIYDPNNIVTQSVEQPDETKPKEHDVPADLPKRIIIPKIGVKGLVQLVSTDQYERIAVPNNIYIAGWYINSVRPGEEGLSIIGGHRDGIKNKGVFYNLEKLKKDDSITIEYGDGSLREFTVLEVIQIQTEDAQELMYERVEGVEKQLVLVTCGGTYNKELKTYEDRILVRAKGL